jgi:hypothetical protein
LLSAKQKQLLRKLPLHHLLLRAAKRQVPDLTSRKLFSFAYISQESFGIQVIANKNKVNDRTIFAAGEISNKPCFLKSADTFQHMFNYLIDTGNL